MITSAQNGKIKRIANLLKKGKARREEGLFVSEGKKMFLEVLRQFPERIEEAVFTEAALAEIKEELSDDKDSLDKLSEINFETADVKVFNQLAETVTPQGVIALIKTPQYDLKDFERGKKLRLLVLDGLRDPGNLGTIVRTAEAAGVSGILMSSDCVDITNPKVVRSTMGGILRVPYVYAESLSESLDELKNASEACGRCLKVYATALHNEAVMFDEIGYDTDTAIIIGNEANGVTNDMIEYADKCILIPMEGKVESLNASVAAALVMYEMRR